MAKRHTKSSDSDGIVTTLYGDALAVGENTFTSVDAEVSTIDRGKVKLADGKVSATAVASEGDTTWTSTTTDVFVSGADLAILWEVNAAADADSSTYNFSSTTFRALDVEVIDGDIKTIEIDRQLSDLDVAADLDGNTASVSFDAKAMGEDSLVTVDAYALALEDQLSQSTVVVTSAVA